MDKISEFIIGTKVETTLLVKTAAIRKIERSGKEYLNAEFTDGISTIKAVYWDYPFATAPNKNTIVDISGDVSEYNGAKQITVKHMKRNEELAVSVFAPSSSFNVSDYMAHARTLIESIHNMHVQEILDNVFNDYTKLWETIPAAKGVHHAFVAGNLIHSVDVAEKALAIAYCIPDTDKDLCIAGGLLQDFGKLWTYEFDGALIEMTDNGQLLEHIAIGIAKLEKYRTEENSKVLDLLQHLIASHHSKIEYGSTSTPKFMEAWIVATADSIDSKARIIFELNEKTPPGQKWTEKEWALENRPMLTQSYVKEIMNS